MNYLNELVSFISQNKIKQHNTLLPGGTSRQSNIYKLYQGIRSQEITSDDDIIQTFFADADHGATYANRLKRKLRDRLTNTVFLIDLNQAQYTDAQRAYISCHKNLAAIQILGSRYVRKSAIEIAKNTLRQSLHYGFTEITLSIARYLHMFYGSALRDQKRTAYYRELLTEQGGILQYELKAERYFIELNQSLSYSSNTEEQLELARTYSEELWPLLERIKTPKFNLYVYLFTLQYHELMGNFEEMVHISSKAIGFYQQNPQLANITTRYVLALNNLFAHTQLKQFDKAEEVGLQAMQQMDRGTGPWYSLAHYLMINFYHSEKFSEAAKFLQRIKREKSFKSLSGQVREQWRFHEAFAFFFAKTLELRESELYGSTFKVQKFINEVPDSARDKEGSNTTILVVQILVCLVQERYDDIIKRSDSLKTYTNRYLRKDNNFRSNCFIKMLLQLPAADFHRAAVERKSEKWYKKLLSQPPNIFRYGTEHEYVPYEILWKYVLDNLEHKFHYT
jgi:hypothetical protein